MDEIEAMQVQLEVLKYLLEAVDDSDEMDELSYHQLEIHLLSQLEQDEQDELVYTDELLELQEQPE